MQILVHDQFFPVLISHAYADEAPTQRQVMATGKPLIPEGGPLADKSRQLLSTLAMERFSPQGPLRRGMPPGLLAARLRQLRAQGLRVSTVHTVEWEGLKGQDDKVAFQLQLLMA